MGLFTPGIFKYEDNTVFTDAGSIVCNTASRYTPDYKRRLEEQRANAKLFAASKKLLEACEDALDLIIRLDMTVHSKSLQNDADRAVSFLEAAIVAAGGRDVGQVPESSL